MHKNLQALLEMAPITVQHDYDRRDTILYALGIGIGLLGAEPDDLRYLLEDRLEAFPTMAAVLAHPGFWLREPAYGLDWKRILHRSQYLRLYKALPVEGKVTGVTKVTAIRDRGALRGAMVVVAREMHDNASGDHLATATSIIALRGDGKSEGQQGEFPDPPAVFEDSAAGLLQARIPSAAGQALLYRLSGDYNPLHADPAVAASAGFPGPILHGLCSLGIAARAVTQLAGDDGAKRLREFEVAFASPVFPGEGFDICMSKPVDGACQFNARIGGRLVLANGVARFNPAR